MDKNKELVNILRAELTLLTKDILQNIHQKDLKDLYKATRQLQEKMAAIMVLKDQLETGELMRILKREEVKSPVEKQPEPDKFEEKDTEIMKAKPADNPYKTVNKISFVPKDEVGKSNPKSTSFSAQHKKINIGLNDRIAFIKHLFDGNQKFYTDFIDRLNAFDNYEAALRYVNQEVKPEFNNWDGKDEYEFRLLQLLELKFS